jgi:hypothetical protein
MNARFLLLPVFLGLLSQPALAQNDGRLEAALNELRAFHKEIADSNARVNQLYSYENAPRTIQKEFDRLGARVDFARSWGGWLWMQAHPDYGLFATYDQYPYSANCPQGALNDSIAYVRATRVVDDEDLAYMRRAMQLWRKSRNEALGLLARKVSNLGQRGLCMQRRDAAPSGSRERQALERMLGELAKDIRALDQRINAVVRSHPISTLRHPAFACYVERREGLLMGLKHILTALDLQQQRALADRVFWQRVDAGQTFFTLDSVRIRAISARDALPSNAAVTW